jgi:hypothetical protein
MKTQNLPAPGGNNDDGGGRRRRQRKKRDNQGERETIRGGEGERQTGRQIDRNR